MAMIVKHDVLKILASDESQIYIPVFQRRYVWTNKHVNQLLNDFIDFYEDNKNHSNEVKYFLGTMTYKEIGIDDDKMHKQISLIDGQQRLWTILLILKALNNLCPLETTPLSEPLDSYIYLDPQQKNDLRFYRNTEIEMIEKVLKDYQNQNEFINMYIKNFNYIQKYLNQEHVDKIAFTLKNTIIGWVKLQKNDNENRYFELINARGLKLSAADLIKNYLFSKTGFFKKKEKEIIDLYKEVENIFQNNHNFLRIKNVERTFFRYLIADFSKWNILVNLDTSEIYEGFKDLIKEQKIELDNFESLRDFLKRVLHFALIFKIVLIKNENIELKNKEDSKHMFFMNLLRENHSLIPLYTQLIMRITEIDKSHNLHKLKWKKGPYNEFKVLEFITKNIIYRQIVGKRLKSLTRDFPRFLRQYNDNFPDEELDLDKFEMFLHKTNSGYHRQMPDYLEVIDKLKQLDYGKGTLVKNVLLLCEIESHNKDVFRFQEKQLELEHLFPIASEDWKDDFETYEEWIKFDQNKHNISNLTLLSKKVNSSISNGKWKYKVETIYKNDGLNINKLLYDKNSVEKYGEELLSKRMKFIEENFIKFFNINVDMDKVKENELLKKRNNMSVKQTIKPSFYVQINHHSRKLNNEEKFFKIIKKNDIIDNKYINRKWPMYEKNILVKAFYLYLYEGKSVGVIDADLLGIYKKTHDGWYTWHLLKLYHIETSKVNRGILKKQGISEDDARKLIAEFVSDNEITENYPYF